MDYSPDVYFEPPAYIRFMCLDTGRVYYPCLDLLKVSPRYDKLCSSYQRLVNTWEVPFESGHLARYFHILDRYPIDGNKVSVGSLSLVTFDNITQCLGISRSFVPRIPTLVQSPDSVTVSLGEGIWKEEEQQLSLSLCR